ncbi:MAG: ATP-dependent Clp protease ATP-binding subunit [Patescibacteria group bacterium]|jgi:ATP-dependent Clp protease ATP-binding subunit ClpC
MALDILNKFTNHLKNTLVEAINVSIRLKHPQVLPVHLLIGLSKQTGSIATEIINQHKLTTKTLQPHLEHMRWINQQRMYTLPQLSAEAIRILEHAAVIAFECKHKYVGTEHLLLSLLDLANDQLTHIFKAHQVNLEQIRKQIINILNSTSRFPDVANLFQEDAEVVVETATGEQLSPRAVTNLGTPALDFFCVNLTDATIQKTIDPVIGRSAEIEQLIHVLSRRTKNNPVLLGEPGVGKTAIIEGLAKQILQGNVPAILLRKKIYRLDLSLVVAGSMYRGEFEARFKQIIEELKIHTNIILFIDEIHTIIGAGGLGANAMDAANILKPGLARGEIRCIGATTINEYQKYIESDAALERRFRPIYVTEPSSAEAITVLQGIKNSYEKFHRVTISNEAITAAVNFSTRYIQDKFLPDKAIDLIDEAAARYKVTTPTNPLEKNLLALEQQLETIQTQKLTLVKQEKFEQVLALKKQEKQLKDQLATVHNKLTATQPVVHGIITALDIAQVIAQNTGIPLPELVTPEKKRLLNLQTELNKRVIGQTDATALVAKLIQRSRTGLARPNRPIGSFMFLGPSGVGKTELAKTLANQVFGSEKNMLRLDMSEFSESFTISKLIGAPAGYVGYKDGAKLTDQIKHKPYALVLFDEIEKAHPDVFNILLQILDEGTLTDAAGKKINFKNTIIVLTSNIGLQHFQQQAALGFQTKTTNKLTNEKITKQVTSELHDVFKPEFLNRIDNIVIFKPLTKTSLIKIVTLQLNELFARAKDQHIYLTATLALHRHLANISYTPTEGARAIHHHIQNDIENVLAEKILKDEIKSGDKVTIDFKQGKIVFTKK